jgi:hypothetical protein
VYDEKEKIIVFRRPYKSANAPEGISKRFMQNSRNPKSKPIRKNDKPFSINAKRMKGSKYRWFFKKP